MATLSLLHACTKWHQTKGPPHRRSGQRVLLGDFSLHYQETKKAKQKSARHNSNEHMIEISDNIEIRPWQKLRVPRGTLHPFWGGASLVECEACTSTLIFARHNDEWLMAVPVSLSLAGGWAVGGWVWVPVGACLCVCVHGKRCTRAFVGSPTNGVFSAGCL